MGTNCAVYLVNFSLHLWVWFHWASLEE
jgi:hypothetical protein